MVICFPLYCYMFPLIWLYVSPYMVIYFPLYGYMFPLIWLYISPYMVICFPLYGYMFSLIWLYVTSVRKYNIYVLGKRILRFDLNFTPDTTNTQSIPDIQLQFV